MLLPETLQNLALPLRRQLEKLRYRHGPWGHLFSQPTDDTVIAIDCETTGLDTRKDALVSIAAVEITDNEVRRSTALSLTLETPEQLSAHSIRIHRLRPMDLDDGEQLVGALEQLLDFIGNRPLVGWCVAFDVAMINRALKPLFGFHLPNQTIELTRLYQQILRRQQPEAEADMRFEAMLEKLHIPVLERHSALGDAVMSGLMYVRLKRGQII